jgi:large subunit ribosomal protein L3
MRMAGRMGVETITVQNLTVHAVDPDRGLILVKGAIPGARGTVVIVRSAAKAKGDEQ